MELIREMLLGQCGRRAECLDRYEKNAGTAAGVDKATLSALVP